MNSRIKRIIMTVFGVLVSGFSVGMFKSSAFGIDPFQVFANGVWRCIPISFGLLYTIINLIMLGVIFLFDKRKIGLGTLINIFLVGYVVQFSTQLFSELVPNPTLWDRVAFLVIGIIIMCFGSSLYFTGNMGVSTYDAVALILSERKVARFFICRVCTDFICTGIGFFLGVTVGIGTVFTAFFMGPVIEFFNRNISIPLLYGRTGKNTAGLVSES